MHFPFMEGALRQICYKFSVTFKELERWDSDFLDAINQSGELRCHWNCVLCIKGE